MREYACTRRELSCIIGNLFAELTRLGAACDSDADELTISGRTYTGAQAVLTVTEWGFRFDGDPSGDRRNPGKEVLAAWRMKRNLSSSRKRKI